MTIIRHHERKLLLIAGVVMLNGILAVTMAQGSLDYGIIGIACGLIVSFMVVEVFWLPW